MRGKQNTPNVKALIMLHFSKIYYKPDQKKKTHGMLINNIYNAI